MRSFGRKKSLTLRNLTILSDLSPQLSVVKWHDNGIETLFMMPQGSQIQYTKSLIDGNTENVFVVNGGGVIPPPTECFLLLETGGHLLFEVGGGALLLEVC